MPQTLFQKVWDLHTVRRLPSGQTQLFVGLHLVHEVTTPQAFDMLRQHGWKVAFPGRTFGTIDHIVPTDSKKRPFIDLMAEDMTAALERNCREAGIPLWTLDSASDVRRTIRVGPWDSDASDGKYASALGCRSARILPRPHELCSTSEPTCKSIPRLYVETGGGCRAGAESGVSLARHQQPLAVEQAHVARPT